jgi:hypothetical protein
MKQFAWRNRIKSWELESRKSDHKTTFNQKCAEYRTLHCPLAALRGATLDILTWVHLPVCGNTICIYQHLETIRELIGPVVCWRILK